MRRAVRLALRTALLLVALLLIVLAVATWALRGSLATLDGELRLPGLSAPVTIERDALGSATIVAANEADAMRALGYVHAQERFFEMDLLRRSAAGELSALFGARAIQQDKAVRVHRMRQRVRANLAALAGDRLPVLQAYTAGVNAGLQDLSVRPWPYLLLRTAPEAWRPEDTGLAGYAMFFDLQDETNSRELALWRIRQVLPPALYRLVGADGTEWDAPLLGRSRGNAVLPTAAEIDLRQLPTPALEREHAQAEPAAPGSNNFAVDGTLTADGRAILANDMHLGLRAPNLWFRARLRYADARAPGGRVDVSGFTLPGTPLVVVGSNRHVAWGFTNSYGDWADWIALPSDASVRRVQETIEVLRGDRVVLEVDESAWGPVLERDGDRRLALYWIAHQPGSLTLGLADFAHAANLDQAQAMATRIGIPQQNLLLADRHGDIAWKLVGRVPLRPAGSDPRAVIAAPQATPWPTGTGPDLSRPSRHRLWTANARTVDGAALAAIGDAGYANGARARQIRDALFARDQFSERDLLAIQLDDRALFLERWWRLLRERAMASPEHAAWQQLEGATRRWDGRAMPDSISYRLVRAWRLAMVARIREGLMAPAMASLGADFVMPDLPQIEGAAWPLASTRPAHLLPRKYRSWSELETEAAQDVVDKLGELGPIAKRTWGEHNRARICHPLAGALPGPLADRLCMPRESLAGDGNMPLVSAPAFGASERMVVAPGHEEDGIIHLPGGASGHPLSPFWGAGHRAWVRGEPTPFLPGPAAHRIQARP